MRFIGCKNNLLPNIEELINEKCKNSKVFCDIFAGTGSVGLYFKDRYKILANDLMYFSYSILKGVIELNHTPNFEKVINKILKGYSYLKVEEINLVISYLNNLNIENYNGTKFIYNTYSPKADRMYLSESNALKIDFIRETIELWKNDNLIGENEYFYLIACLIQEIPSFSNISGTYGAFLKTWDKRALKEFKVQPLNIKVNNFDNKVYNQNGNELIKNINGDILYIDPPYNSRQYLPNYHLLETVAKYDMPEVKGITGVRKYDDQKSNWCLKTKVETELEELIKNAKFKHIILSYSSEGLMNKEYIKKIFEKYGVKNTFQIIEIPYRRFRSRSVNAKHDVVEFLFYVEKKV